MAKASSTHSFSVHLRAASFLRSSCPPSLVLPPSLSLSLSLRTRARARSAFDHPPLHRQIPIPHPKFSSQLSQFLIQIPHPIVCLHCNSVQFDHPPLQWHIPIPHPNPPLHIPHPNSSFPLTNANSSKKQNLTKKVRSWDLKPKMLCTFTAGKIYIHHLFHTPKSLLTLPLGL
jgi:hypothetical protein